MCFWARAEVACPKTNLLANGLDVYQIIWEDEILSFRFHPDNVVGLQTSITYWESMLDACGAQQTIERLQIWKKEQSELRSLGILYNSQRIFAKRKVRKQIRAQEKLTALKYAQMLDVLEREVGIAVVWDVENHRGTKGMVSTARGSIRIVDYIYSMYGIESLEDN